MTASEREWTDEFEIYIYPSSGEFGIGIIGEDLK
jgi:hypothetical protein